VSSRDLCETCPEGSRSSTSSPLPWFGPFLWWTMHFLLARRVPWTRLLPSALATGLFAAGLGVFSTLYFSSTIISDDRLYGPIGAVFDLVSWLIAIGAVVILGAVAGALWQERQN
jgi:membrane protein